MKINYKKYTSFEDIKAGDAFLYGSSAFMKVKREYSLDQNTTDINAVNLETGELKYFDYDTQVINVDAEVLITRGEA